MYSKYSKMGHQTFLRARCKRWKLLSTQMYKYTTREKLGHQMPLFFDTSGGDTNSSLC